MKKVLVLVILSLFVATSVFAEGLAVGWEDGLSCKIPVGNLTLQGVLNYYHNSPQASGADSYNSFHIAGYGALPIIEMGQSTMNVFGGINFGTFTDYDLDVALRGGIQHDVMVTDQVGVTGKAGLEIYMEGGRSGVKDSGSTQFGTWGTVGIFWYLE